MKITLGTLAKVERKMTSLFSVEHFDLLEASAGQLLVLSFFHVLEEAKCIYTVTFFILI